MGVFCELGNCWLWSVLIESSQLYKLPNSDLPSSVFSPKIDGEYNKISYSTKLLPSLHFPAPPISLSMNMTGGRWDGGNRYGIGDLGDYLVILDTFGIDK